MPIFPTATAAFFGKETNIHPSGGGGQNKLTGESTDAGFFLVVPRFAGFVRDEFEIWDLIAAVVMINVNSRT